MSTSNNMDILSDDESVHSALAPTLIDDFIDSDDEYDYDDEDDELDADDEDDELDADDEDNGVVKHDGEGQHDTQATNVSAIKENNSYIKNLVDDSDLKIIEHDACVNNFEKKGLLGLMFLFNPTT